MWGVYGMRVDEEGNFYISEVTTGRAQIFVSRADADSDLVISRFNPTY